MNHGHDNILLNNVGIEKKRERESERGEKGESKVYHRHKISKETYSFL